MVKTAPAPSTSSSSGLLKGAGIVVLVLAAIGFASAQGWFSGAPDPDLEPDRGPKKLVTFEVVWGQIRETGEVYEDTGERKEVLECDDRELNITAFVDGEAEILDRSDVDEECHVRYSIAVPEGSDLRLLVEEVSAGWWKMCAIYVEGAIALPNGWAIEVAGADCHVWGVAL